MTPFQTIEVLMSSRRLSPEEDSIGELDTAEDEIDDQLPADLWF